MGCHESFMRKLLIGTFAVLAAVLPAPAQDEQVATEEPLKTSNPATTDSKAYLVIIAGSGSSMSVIPVRDLAQCEEQGAVWMASERLRVNGQYKGYECFEGVK